MTETLKQFLSQSDLLTPMAIRVAATYRLADHITAGASSVSELARASGLSLLGVGRLVRLLVTEGLFAWSDSGDLTLTSTGELLREGDAAGQRAWLDLDGFGGRVDQATFELRESLVTGAPAYARAHGQDLWGDLAANPAIAASFDALMGAQAAAIVPHIVDAFDWLACARVLDVGGGTGALAIGLASSYPAIQVTVLDLPSACRVATQRFEAAGFAKRCAAVPGTFFGRLPENYDAYVLSLVLHNWDDPNAERILRRCRDVLSPTSRVLLIEAIRDEAETTSRDLAALDLRMLLLTGGFERTLTDYARLASEAELALVSVVPLPAWRNRWIIELRLDVEAQ